MNIIGVILFLSAILLFFAGCSSVQTPRTPPATPAPAIRIQAEQVMPIEQTNSGPAMSLPNGFTGTVNLRWQWPTNGNTNAFVLTYAIVQETVDPSTSSGQGLGNWQSIATICYTSAPAYSFNVTNSPQMFFRLRETIPGLY